MLRTDAKADAYNHSLFLTLDVDTTHFNELSPFSIFEISHTLSLPLLRCEFSSR
jgi:hypothetical protein